METRLAGLASCVEVGRSSNVSVDTPVGILVDKEPLSPPGVIRSVEVLRGVGIALRSSVGEGVHVGNIWTRFVALGRIGVGCAEVGVDVGVGAAQLASNKMSPRKRYLVLLTVWLPSGYGLPEQSLPAQQVTVF